MRPLLGLRVNFIVSPEAGRYSTENTSENTQTYRHYTGSDKKTT